MKVYIEDHLWNSMADECNIHDEECKTYDFIDSKDPREMIIENMEKIFRGVNKHLDNLDNGGYMVEFDRKVVKLVNSDVVLQQTYVDRMNGNVTKDFDIHDIIAITFAFQESVALLKERNAVDLRILVALKSPDSPAPYQYTIGTAEEACLCNPDTFACVAVFGIEDISYWEFHTGKCQKQPW